MPDKKRKLIFRADGNNQIGLGHVIRSLALADLLSTDDYECAFAIRTPSEALKLQISKACDPLIELPSTSENDILAEAHWLVQEVIQPNDIVILDGYHFTTDYQRIIKKNGNGLICIDDLHAHHFVADAVINHAGGINASDYSVEAYTKLYLGPSFALLRKPFLEAAKRTPRKVNLNNAFINMGGADSSNHTLAILKQVMSIPSIQEIHIVLGSAYSSTNELKAFCQNYPYIQLHYNLTAEAMCKLMEDCGIAICPPSTVSYEYCSVKGLCFLKQTAANQMNMFNYLTSRGLAFPFEKIYQVLDSANQYINDVIRNQLTYLCAQIEQNCNSIIEQVSISIEQVQLRRATPADLALYFQWTNDSEVRKNAFHQDMISLEQHRKWFAKKLSDPNAILYVCERKGVPVGQVRIDLENQNGIISYSVDKSHRGKGIGKILIRQTIEALLTTFADRYKILIAKVRPENTPSVQIFQSLGFHRTGEETVNNALAWVFTYEL